MKPVLLVDIDDTLANYCDPFLEFLGMNGIEIRKDDILISFTEMGVDPIWFERFEVGLPYLGPIEGSQKAVQELSKTFSLKAVTSRGSHLKNVTEGWLLKFPEIEQAYHTRDKGSVYKEENAICLIEDVIVFAEQVPNVLVYAQPWNKDWKGWRGNWDEIVKMLGG